MQYYLPPKRLITWPHIYKILNGEKLLLKQSSIKISVIPPKIKHLQVKEIWNRLKNDPEIFRYFPDNCLKDEPPRHYFFAVLATLKPEILQQLLQQAEMEYSHKQEMNNNVVELHPRISNELNTINWKYSLLNKKPDQRVSFKNKERRDFDE